MDRVMQTLNLKEDIEMNVQDIMTTDVATCSQDTNLEAIANLMWNKNCGSIPVLNQSGEPIGLVTDRDIAMGCALNHKALWELSARDILGNRQVHFCMASDAVKSSLQKMSQYHIRRLPVVNDEGHLVGILSLGDIVALAESEMPGKMPEVSFGETINTLKQVYVHH
jgi:CBS domain-containing protein